MQGKRSFIAPIIGLVAGLGIGYVDSRPTWDDAGITAGAVFLTSLVLGALEPRLFWLSGLAVGLPVFAFSALLNANYGAVAAVVVSLIGSAIGGLLGRLR